MMQFYDGQWLPGQFELVVFLATGVFEEVGIGFVDGFPDQGRQAIEKEATLRGLTKLAAAAG